MRETREVQIGERRFLVGQLPAMKAGMLLTKLARLTIPAAAKMAGSGALSFENIQVENLSGAAEALFQNFTEKEFETTVRELLTPVQVIENDRTAPLMPMFDLVFQGEMVALFQLLKIALEVNYDDFLGALAARLRALRPGPTPSASKA